MLVGVVVVSLLFCCCVVCKICCSKQDLGEEDGEQVQMQDLEEGRQQEECLKNQEKQMK